MQTPQLDVGPSSDDEAPTIASSDTTAAAAPSESPLDHVYYPIAEAGDDPQVADAWLARDGAESPSNSLPDTNRTAPAMEPPIEGDGNAASRTSQQALAAVRQQVALMNHRAMSLARRGALFSARSELLESLRLSAQAQDARNPASECVAKLAAALAAMDEADDFASSAADRRRPESLEDITRSHQTPLLKGMDAARMSNLTAGQHYLAYAQQQLTAAVGADPSAAQSLYLLGKIHSYLAAESTAAQSQHTARAIVFHTAALGVNPQHYQAANELGVLLARFGELGAAKQMLLASVTSRATPSAWHNLAVVHERLGETDLASKARYEAQLAGGNAPKSVGGPSVQWVDAVTFAAQSPSTAADIPAAKTAQAAASTDSRASRVRR